jgi:hypothetical protein
LSNQSEINQSIPGNKKKKKIEENDETPWSGEKRGWVNAIVVLVF